MSDLLLVIQLLHPSGPLGLRVGGIPGRVGVLSCVWSRLLPQGAAKASLQYHAHFPHQ